MEQIETANAYRKYFTMYFVYTYGRFSAQPSLQDFAQVILVILPDQEVSNSSQVDARWNYYWLSWWKKTSIDAWEHIPEA